MAEHTPGPWTSDGDSVHALLPNGASVEIARVNPLQELRTAPEFANTRLISAAPDLLEALEKLCGASPVLDAYHHAMPNCECAYCRGRAAIAKAKGVAA